MNDLRFDEHSSAQIIHSDVIIVNGRKSEASIIPICGGGIIEGIEHGSILEIVEITVEEALIAPVIALEPSSQSRHILARLIGGPKHENPRIKHIRMPEGSAEFAAAKQFGDIRDHENIQIEIYDSLILGVTPEQGFGVLKWKHFEIQQNQRRTVQSEMS